MSERDRNVEFPETPFLNDDECSFIPGLARKVENSMNLKNQTTRLKNSEKNEQKVKNFKKMFSHSEHFFHFTSHKYFFENSQNELEFCDGSLQQRNRIFRERNSTFFLNNLFFSEKLLYFFGTTLNNRNLLYNKSFSENRLKRRRPPIYFTPHYPTTRGFKLESLFNQDSRKCNKTLNSANN